MNPSPESNRSYPENSVRREREMIWQNVPVRLSSPNNSTARGFGNLARGGQFGFHEATQIASRDQLQGAIRPGV
jgi:hypothetical protein